MTEIAHDTKKGLFGVGRGPGQPDSSSFTTYRSYRQPVPGFACEMGPPEMTAIPLTIR
jgi:hypothetical protein